MPDLPLLITGAHGQVGGAAARFARERGIACETPVRAELDLADAASIHRYMDGKRWRAILNCAAYTAVDRAESEPELAHAVNAIAPGMLADHAARQDCPIVHVSTDYVFDGTKAEPYVETDPVAPLGVYGVSKAAGEDAVRAAAPDAHVIVRTAWVLSAGGANFLNTMLRLGAERDQLGVVADQHGCPTNADDLADALLAMLERDRAPGTWHAVNGGETTWHGLACHIFDRAAAAGLKVPEVRAIATADYPTPARRPANSRLATAKLHDDFGLTLRPWQDAVDAILAERLAR